MIVNPLFEEVPITFSRLTKIWWSLFWRQWGLIAIFGTVAVFISSITKDDLVKYSIDSTYMVFEFFLIPVMFYFLLFKFIIGIRYKDFMIKFQPSLLPIWRQILQISTTYLIFSFFAWIFFASIGHGFIFVFLKQLLTEFIPLYWVINQSYGKVRLSLQKIEENPVSAMI